MSNNGAAKAADWNELLDELTRQEWRLETKRGDAETLKAFPPDQTNAMVIIERRFAGKPGQMVELVRHLKQQGFIWPPPRREPVLTAAPFLPQPHPAVRTASVAETREAERQAESEKSALDLAFLNLKDAKDFVDLAGDELRRAQTAVDIAQKQLEGATRAYREALADLKVKKNRFDEMTAYDELSEVTR